MSTLAAPAPTAAISLYFREGSSDKVYHAQIVPNGDDLYAVSFQYGRRGSTLQNGSKTAVPVTLAEARKIFDKLVAEKKAKGYTEGERGVPYSSGELANRRFEYTPQLLNFIDEPAMLECLGRPDWFMQEKIDGVRQIVECRAGNVTAGNRNGLTVAVSAAIVEAVFTLGHDCVLDGEATGDVYWPFDLLSFDGYDITQRSATQRLRLLTATLSAKPSNALGRVRSAFTDEAKRALLETIKTERGEGIVLKNANARYAPGRPASGGDALKHKFTGSATCSVVSHNRGKRSVLIAVHNDNDDASALRPLIEIGNVAIPRIVTSRRRVASSRLSTYTPSQAARSSSQSTKDHAPIRPVQTPTHRSSSNRKARRGQRTKCHPSAKEKQYKKEGAVLDNYPNEVEV